MLSRQQIKYINFLRQKKYRQQYNAFIAEGVKTASEFLKSSFTVTDIYAVRAWIEKHERIIPKKVHVHEVSRDELKKISSLTTPNEVLMVLEQPRKEPGKELAGDIALLLDNIQDPGNLGTIIRTADWFGIENIFCSRNCTDAYSPKVVQAAMGSLCRVNVFYENLDEIIEKHRDIPVYGAVLTGENIYKKKLRIPAFIMIGNESGGISEEMRKYIEHPVAIPGAGGAESLNAAVAAAIICSEFRRGGY